MKLNSFIRGFGLLILGFSFAFSAHLAEISISTVPDGPDTMFCYVESLYVRINDGDYINTISNETVICTVTTYISDFREVDSLELILTESDDNGVFYEGTATIIEGCIEKVDDIDICTD